MKYQLHCPKCHHEFAYDNEHMDNKIAQLGYEIRDIICQLAEHKMLPMDKQRQRTDWWLRAKRTLAYKQKELARLKALRKANDQQINVMEYQAFKAVVKENVGEETYISWLTQANKELEAYKVSGLMRHEYTRSNAKSTVTSISKL